MQYLEILKETTKMEMSQDEHFPPEISWKYDEEKEYEIRQTHIHPDMNPDYLVNEPGGMNLSMFKLKTIITKLK
ncbi:hypothetical protein RclHR1_38770003 [Rhizophagus clarus]|uniref:Uncharacterized protein n=1 Tax=Rhizophagus clarus TaxID=94130 RepID=A0A2Z6RD56_9GLOM|nr:hypothetical protein RclHR1_38770003 [Rhizophagus clarus]GET03056.1 hypothetical protein RCL_e16878_RclHR1_38770003 [Rhizophagus clarus]